MINITCPCLFPIVLTITDEDGDETVYWALPDDEIDGQTFDIPKLDYTERDGKDYVAVLWNDPEGADLKSYEVNDHLVFAGCSFGDKLKRGGKMVCREKELYMVLHPKDEWESYHIRNLKA